MRKTITVTVLLIVPLLLLGFAGVSQAQLVLYEDFSGDIDPAKWSGSEASAGASAPNTEAVREVEDGQLEMDLTHWGKTTSNSGDSGLVSNRLGVTHPTPITTFQADVTVKSATVVGCAANATRTRARAQINGAFFNDGTSPGPGDRTGDIIGNFQVHRDSGTGDQVQLNVNRCTNPSCSTFTQSPTIIFAASWVQGVPNTLNIQWDEPNKRMIFTLNPGVSQEQHIVSFGGPVSAPPVGDFKQLQVQDSAASCLSGPRTSANIQALFDNVMVNP